MMFLNFSFWRQCGATAHLKGATHRRPIPKAAKFWWDSTLPLWSLSLEFVHIFHSFAFDFFDLGKYCSQFYSFFYYFDPGGKWRSEKSRGWNRCARAFHCLESWNILKMIKILHGQICRPTGLFKNWLWRHNLSFLSFNAVTKCLKKLPFSSEPTLLAGAQVTLWLWPLQKVVSFHNPFALKTWSEAKNLSMYVESGWDYGAHGF